MKKVTLSIMTGLALFAFASCGGNSDQDTTTTAPTEMTDDDATSDEVAGPITIELNAGDDMKFDKDILEAKPGQEVTLILHHTGKMTKETMGHNFVLLKQGTDVNAFGQAAAADKENDHIPAGMKDQVIVHTDLIGGGESTQITFKAPEAGNYPFLCSFPGHFGSMKGTFIVE